jgi:hypothetical protein
MRFEFPKVTKEIRLAEYEPAMGEAAIQVWVNVPRPLIERMAPATIKGASNDEIDSILQELWGAEDWPVEDIEALWRHCQDNDPQLWMWLIKRTWELVYEYRRDSKKD